MKKSKCKILLLISAALISCAIILMLFTIAFTEANDEIKELKSLLDMGELLVDYDISGNLAYAIVSRQKHSDYGDLLVIFGHDGDQKWKRIYDNDFTGLKPWKITLADIDGDGQEEILTAVRKTTIYDKIEENRLFIFNYSDNILVKKWTGSRIAGRWRSFYAGELLPIPGQELIFIEKTADGREQLSIYYWFDFGFIMLAKSKEYKNISKVSILEENLIEIEYDSKQTVLLTVKDGKITEATDRKE